jgi:hypothetical protein
MVKTIVILLAVSLAASGFADPESDPQSHQTTIQSTEAPVSVGSPFEMNELTITIFDAALSPGSGRFSQEFASILAAANLVEIANFPVFDKGWTVIAGRQDGESIVDSYHAVQAYDFGPDSTLSLELYLMPRETPEGKSVTLMAKTFSLSARAEVGDGEEVVIGGLAVPGNYPRLVVFKVLGPSLAAFGIETPLSNPRVTLFRGNEKILENDNWQSLRIYEQSQSGLVCLPPTDANESLISTYLEPGLYTAVVSGEAGANGIALLEMHIQDRFWIETPE